jgi:hypothetical protein
VGGGSFDFELSTFNLSATTGAIKPPRTKLSCQLSAQPFAKFALRDEAEDRRWDALVLGQLANCET